MSDPLAYQKLFVLYMLRQADFPVSGSQIDECLLEGEYFSYFELKEAVCSLTESGLVAAQSKGTVTYYVITSQGQQVLEGFHTRLPESICRDVSAFMRKNRERMKDESSVFAQYERRANGECEVHCRAVEHDRDLIHLTVCVPDEEQARLVCLRWIAKCQPVYEAVMRELLS